MQAKLGHESIVQTCACCDASSIIVGTSSQATIDATDLEDSVRLLVRQEKMLLVCKRCVRNGLRGCVDPFSYLLLVVFVMDGLRGCVEEVNSSTSSGVSRNMRSVFDKPAGDKK